MSWAPMPHLGLTGGERVGLHYPGLFVPGEVSARRTARIMCSRCKMDKEPKRGIRKLGLAAQNTIHGAAGGLNFWDFFLRIEKIRRGSNHYRRKFSNLYLDTQRYTINTLV